LTEFHVLQAQGGSDASFTQLHELWRHDVVRLATINLRDAGAAAEVAQDAWVAVARGLGRLQDPACFPRWLFLIVKRRSADWVRRRQRERRAQSKLEEEASPPATADAGSVASPLAQAIETLAPSERELLSLYYEIGRSVAEIAEILNVPAGTVKSRLHTLRERLRHIIERETS
jgi:RNA polymerase sigma-70 factor (ECF subfamily)